MCTFLGTRTPIVLRQVALRGYRVIGICYIHGLQDGEGILGPLPEQWKVQFVTETNGVFVPRFVNTLTEEETVQDPRLGPLPEPWECLPAVRTPDDPLIFARYRNKKTGEVMNSDPRMLPDALRARGVPLETFRLV